VDTTGRAWAALPHDFPAEGTVRDHFHQWRRQGLWRQNNDTLRRRVRRREGRTEEEPSAAVIDGQLAKSSRTSGTSGYDASTKIKGIKRHKVVDTLGLLLLVVVHSAAHQDRDGAQVVLEQARGLWL
jgi:putative transposase